MARGNIDYDQIRSAARRGDGPLIQMGSGAGFTPGNVLVYDANGNAVDGGSGTTGGGVPGSLSGTIDLIPASPNMMDDEFIAGSLDAKWTPVNSASGDLSFSYGRMAIAPTGTMRALTQPEPSTPCEFIMKFTTQYGNEGGNPWIAIGFSDGTKYQVMAFGYINGAHKFEVENLSAFATFNNSAGVVGIAFPRHGEWWVRIQDNGTNLIYAYSFTGDGYHPVATISRTAWMGSGPTKVAIHWNNGSLPGVFSIDYFRRIS